MFSDMHKITCLFETVEKVEGVQTKPSKPSQPSQQVISFTLLNEFYVKNALLKMRAQI